MITTVNCHSSFSHQCCPPPWTNIPPRQFRREPASHKPFDSIHSYAYCLSAFPSSKYYTAITTLFSKWCCRGSQSNIQPSLNESTIASFSAENLRSKYAYALLFIRMFFGFLQATSAIGKDAISFSSKGSDPSVYVLLYMFASYHLPPQQFSRAHASSYQPITQSPSFHQPRHTLQTHSSLPPPKPTGKSVVPTALTPHPTNTALSSK